MSLHPKPPCDSMLLRPVGTCVSPHHLSGLCNACCATRFAEHPEQNTGGHKGPLCSPSPLCHPFSCFPPRSRWDPGVGSAAGFYHHTVHARAAPPAIPATRCGRYYLFPDCSNLPCTAPAIPSSSPRPPQVNLGLATPGCRLLLLPAVVLPPWAAGTICGLSPISQNKYRRTFLVGEDGDAAWR